MPGGEEFCTRDPHFEGAEVFGSQKRRPDTPIGGDTEIHRPDTVNFSRPNPGKRVTRSQPETLPTIIEESCPSVQEVQVPSPAALDFHRITFVQETKVDVSLWHIVRIPYTSGKSCWANHAGTKKKCTIRIVTNNKNVPALTYTRMWHHYKLQSMKRTDFVFCPDDIVRCVKGPRRKWIMPFSAGQDKPPILPIWPVKIGTNLTRSEIFAFENAGFQLPPKERITPTRLFTNSAPPLDMSQIRVHGNHDLIPPTRLSKLVRRSNNAHSAKHRQMVASTKAMHGTVLKLTRIPQPRFGCITTIQSKLEPQPPIYQMTVSSIPECNCTYFLDMISKFGRK